MNHTGWVLAYHGCDESVAESILAGKEDVEASTNDYDWLGHGAYFWENSYSRALEWAKFLKKRAAGKVKKPAVIGAIIIPGNCLDLTERESIQLLKEAYDHFSAMMATLQIELPVNEKGHEGDRDLVKRNLDCTIVNWLHELGRLNHLPRFETVRGAFFEGGELYPGAKIESRTHIQWAVRDPKKSVFAYFRPRKPYKK